MTEPDRVETENEELKLISLRKGAKNVKPVGLETLVEATFLQQASQIESCEERPYSGQKRATFKFCCPLCQVYFNKVLVCKAC